LQPPQWVWLVFVLTQALPHSISPAPAQPHVPLLQAVAPVGQALQPPQWAMVPSPLDGTHAPPEHIVWPDGHMAEQALLLQTWPLGQTVQLLPQWVASEATQAPPQRNRPVAQAHWPFVHTRPLPHALPQEPQFWLSLVSVLHWPLQLVWPAPHWFPPVPAPPVGLPGVGVAQLAATSRQPSTRALRTVEGERGRVFIDLPRR
jgi:hypothetical protein